jgi:hypothetical protein
LMFSQLSFNTLAISLPAFHSIQIHPILTSALP